MSFWSKKKKSYYCCKNLEETVILHRDWYSICSMYAHRNSVYRPFFNYDEKKGFDYKAFFKVKQSIIKDLKKGKIHQGCIGCKDLKKEEWTGKCDKLYHLHFRLSKKCNAKCIYCGDNVDNKNPDRLFFNDLKKLVKEKKIAPNALMEFGGGEFTLHDEFDEIFRYLLDNGFKRYKVYTSCLRYSPELSEALGYGESEVIISADAGDIETFTKVKQANTYNRFFGNLEKYVSAQKGNDRQVKLKFIIIRNINDSEQQIDSFLNKAKEIGIKKVIFDIDFRDLKMFQSKPDKEIEKHLIDIIAYAKTRAVDFYGLEFEKFCNMEVFEMEHHETLT